MVQYERIVRDPEICGSKPTIKGTRVLVTIILDYLKSEYSFDDIIESFPSITKHDIKEIISYAEAQIEGKTIYYGVSERKIPV